MSAELASVGVSLVSPSHELGYVRAGQLRTTVAMSAARFVVDLEVKTLQVMAWALQSFCVWGP